MILVDLGGPESSPASAGAPLLVLGPSLGTSTETLWAACAELLTGRFHVVGWELPGHGRDRSSPEAVTIGSLAAGVLDAVDGPFAYAGCSVGGAVGLQLLLDAPDRVGAAVLVCTGARIGTPESWADRSAQARTSGTPSLVPASAARWFGPGFLEREPARGSALLHALSDADDAGYAAVCGALAAYDLRGRLGEVTAPILAVAGAHDQATPVADLAEIADGVRDGRLVVLDDASHLAPAERPERLAALITEHLTPTHEEQP